MKSDFVSGIEKTFSAEIPEALIFAYDTLGSTSDEAKQFALSGEKASAFFIAREQTGGRGRRGRSFVSRDGGLYMSYLFYPTLCAKDSVMLTVFTAVALCEVIEETAAVKPKIKWVNDIFLGGKKLAGILAEGGFAPNGETFEYAVIGIGVNLFGNSLDPEIDSIATTLEKESGIRVDFNDFAVRLAKKLTKFEEAHSGSYMDLYRMRSLVLGKRVRMTSAGEEFFASVLNIEDDGAIRILLDEGEEKILYSAEVRLILN